MNEVKAVAVACTLIAGALSVPAPVRAQTSADSGSIKACQAIASDLGRLSCFDGLARQAPKPSTGGGTKRLTSDDASSGPGPGTPAQTGGTSMASGAPSAGSATGAWLHREETNGLDRSTVETVILPAVSGNVGLINKPGLKRGPALVIRCKEKQTAVFVTFDLPVTGPADIVPVQYRIGPTAPAMGQWGRSQDNQAYGFWDNARAISLVQSLLGQEELYVRATPPGKSQSEAGFKLAGIDAAVQPVRAACGW